VNFADSRTALEEATKYALSEENTRWLADLCQRRAVRLGERGVLAHEVAYDPSRWPCQTRGSGGRTRITRGDVFALADAPAMDLFTASYVFGMGLRGYGPHRYDRITAGAPDLSDLLEIVRQIGRCQGPAAAYAQLYGGDGDVRARPGAAPWSRVDGLGPAFFTKFMYFAVPGSLILDNVLAHRVAELSGMPHLLRNGKAVAWTPYRYTVYLHWMTQTATAVSLHTNPLVVTADLLELTLFNSTGGTRAEVAEEGEAGD
jgi:hypothetical protein